MNNDVERFISQLSFRFIQPHIDLANLAEYPRLSKWLRRLNFSLDKITLCWPSPDAERIRMEIVNTKLPTLNRPMVDILGHLLIIPRMSTFAIGAIINHAVSQMPENCCFVNVGVWHGYSLLAGIQQNACKQCIGVDNFSEFGSPSNAFLERFNLYKGAKHYFYEMDYCDYLRNIHKDPIGVYFYDGEHSYSNQLHGLRLAEPFFSKDCIIIVDDVNISHVEQATRDFISYSKYHYKILLNKTTAGNYHPTWWNGITVFQRLS